MLGDSLTEGLPLVGVGHGQIQRALRDAQGLGRNADAAAMPDLSAREIALLAPIAAAVLWMGVYPESFLAPMRSDIRALEARLAPAAPAGDSQIKMGAPKPAGEGHHEEAAAHGEAH